MTFSRFFKRIGNVFNHYLQKESPYMIAMVSIYVGLGMITKGKCDTVNSEYIVAKSKSYHFSYTHLFG
jgi:hypothetical protein